MRDAHDKALSLLRARLFAIKNGILPSTLEVASYDLPDGVEWPNDLNDHRKPSALGESNRALQKTLATKVDTA